MEKRLFGTLPTGEEVYLYTLRNEKAELTLMNRGAAIHSFRPFGRDIIGGFDTLEGYLNDDSNQGVVVGRVANRIGGASFTLDGKEYKLPKNDGNNCLHGGCGYGFKLWEFVEAGENTIEFRYDSFDGEEGFPSKLRCFVRYTLVDAAVIIEYEAVPYGKTPINLTNHSYFNLDGFGGTIENHYARIYADRYTEVNDELIPNGVRPFVKGTVFDFTEPHKIGERLSADFIGYDHNFILKPESSKDFLDFTLPLACEVWNEDLQLNVYTDQPGVQFYIGNFLGNGPDFHGGVKQVFHGGFCLETQLEPDAPNRSEGIYSDGEIYTHKTVYEVVKRG